MRRDEPNPPHERHPGSPPPASGDEHAIEELARARRERVAKAVVALGVAVVLIVFIVANSQPVAVNFVAVTRHPRLIWVMLTCAVLGGVVGYLIGRPGRIRAKRDSLQRPTEPPPAPEEH